MGKLLNLAVYNPAILNDEDFLAGFVARGNLIEQILKRLKEIKSDNIVQHRLFIGQRGMGKTSMLRRIALGVEADSVLSSVLMPLSFREEQYNVHSLHVFWCNCLDALGDYFEKKGLHNLAVQVDKDVARLARAGKDEEGTAALGVFKEWYKKQNKRPILLLDNIDFIFEGLSDQEWTLRRILQEPGGIIIIGATTGMLEASTKVEAPFYDFFQVHHLDRLSHEELVACLRQIAQKRGEPGRKVTHVIDTDPARIHTLYDLTGGNPRTLVLLYMLLEMDSESDVMEDLEQLLDQVTVLYKARVEDLPPQARVVLDAVALNWNPITAAHVAAATSIETSSVSPQLDRLQKLGIVEKVTISTPSPIAYQLSERFFNIWYLMRNASRRQRNRLRWLTEFLKQFYTPQQLCTIAEKFIHRTKTDGHSAGMYGLAMADAVCDKSLRYALNHEATRQLDEYSRKIRAQLEEITDVTELNRSTLDMGALKQTVMNCQRNWSVAEAEEFWDLLGSNPWITFEQKLQIVSQLADMPDAKIEEEIASMRILLKNFESLIQLPKVFKQFQKALREGLLNTPGDISHGLAAAKYYDCEELLLIVLSFTTKHDVENLSRDELDALLAIVQSFFDNKSKELNNFCCKKLAKFFLYASQPAMALKAYRRAIELNLNDTYAWSCLGSLLADKLDRYDEAEATYRKAIEIDPKYDYTWSCLGNLLGDKLDRYDEAEAAYRKAIELNPKDTYVWHFLGNLLADKLDRYDEAEATYRKAIEIDPKNVYAWNCLGRLLADKLDRYDEAEATYRKAIEIDPKYDYTWGCLGNLLADKLDRYDEAEAAYRKAIELNPKDTYVWNFLGNLLADKLDRYDEAEATYRKAIEIDPKNVYAWNCLGRLLADKLDRYDEAEATYRKAIEINPRYVYAWNCLRNLLEDKLGRYDEAEETYLKAIEIDPKNVFPWHNLGNFLKNKLGRYKDAEAAYRKAIEIDPEHTDSWNGLGNLLLDNLERYEEAEAAYHKAIELSPDEYYPKANLTFLLLADPKRCEEAEIVFEEVLNHLPAHGQNLLLAYRALAYDNFGEAKTAFTDALQSDSPELFSCYYDDMLRVLRLAKSRGYGERFLLFLEESGLAERYWPLHAAFAAFLYGEAKLNDVNPEVRGAASRIYTWLAGSQDKKKQKEKEQKTSRSKKVRRKTER